MSSSATKQLQIRLLTFQDDLAVPDNTLTVPEDIKPEGLNKLVHTLLKESKDDYDETVADKRFEFILQDDFLRDSLASFISSHGGVITEAAIEIRYVDAVPPPSPHKDVNHDDWVAGVAAKGDYVLTACYDNTVNLFSAQDGAKKLTIPSHSGPAGAVAWISLDEERGTFASAAHDQVVMLYSWDVKSNSIEKMNACKGHSRKVDCLAVSPSGALMASGSYDTMLKIWGAKVQEGKPDDVVEETEGESEKKKAKSERKALTRTPIMTLGGHKEGVSGVAWMDEDRLATASWDHTIKVWDRNIGGMETELVGDRAFFGLSYSLLNRTIITASSDSAVRLYDPRSKEGVIVKSKYTGHKGWVTSVDWCRTKEHFFVSGGHDNLVKMWDSRSCKTSLYDLKGHDEGVLACDWGETGYVVSGGADNSMKVFKTTL